MTLHETLNKKLCSSKYLITFVITLCTIHEMYENETGKVAYFVIISSFQEMWLLEVTAAEEPWFMEPWIWAYSSSLFSGASNYFRTQIGTPKLYAHISHAFCMSFQHLSCPAPLGLLWSMIWGSVCMCVHACVHVFFFSWCRLSYITLNQRFYVTRKKPRPLKLMMWGRPLQNRNEIQAKHVQLLPQLCLPCGKPSDH